MNGDVEHASGVRGFGAYPSEWGIPNGRPLSAERALWVRDNVLRHHGSAHEKRAARLEALRRKAWLDERREGSS